MVSHNYDMENIWCHNFNFFFTPYYDFFFLNLIIIIFLSHINDLLTQNDLFLSHNYDLPWEYVFFFFYNFFFFQG